MALPRPLQGKARQMSTNRDGLDLSECEELAREIIELAASYGCPAGQSPVHFFAVEIERLRAAVEREDDEQAQWVAKPLV